VVPMDADYSFPLDGFATTWTKYLINRFCSF